MNNGTLPSWKHGSTRQAILEFLQSATRDGPSFIKPADRIATFDNDGTLWCEEPMPVQLDFIIRRRAEMVEAEESKRDVQPYKAVVEKDTAWLRGFEGHIPEILRGLGEAFTEITADQFEDLVRKFFAEARHPRFGNPYQQISYQPVRELIDLLKAYDFRVFIASGGGRDFMRVISEETYGVYREQVIGTAPEHEYRNGQLFRVAKMLGTIDNGPGKPAHIFAQTGRLPALAGGNSNGDMRDA